MAFERPMKIMEALEGIDQYRYALPALQREFVWKPEQICRLFDSLMKGYPIGSFLFWRLSPETARQFRFYQFMRDYHQRTHRYCDEYPMQTQVPEIAVLDGQQRLTAFNIALYGSYAQKKKYARWDNSSAYPVRRLCLNLLAKAPENDANVEFDFRFLTEKEEQHCSENHYWFRVSKIREFDKVFMLQVHLSEEGVHNPQAMEWVGMLYEALRVEPMIHYFEEQDQDLEKVLNIFIRINSGGTPLGYSDLLLSIATTQWQSIDARSAINGLLDELNEYGHEEKFTFTKDFVLKAGLMLIECSNVKFEAKNFTAQNMEAMENNWDAIATTLKLTAQLLESFGLGRRHVRSQNSVLPIAYQLFRQNYDDSFIHRQIHAEEREEMRRVLLMSTLAGVWSGGNVDALLVKIREALKEQSKYASEVVLEVMRQEGRDPYINDEGLDYLLDLNYNDRFTFMLLSLMFDFVDLKNSTFHVDHIYPRAICKKKNLIELGMEEEQVQRIEDRVNKLPNLWLLQGTQNLEKNKKMPLQWLATQYPDEGTRQLVMTQHHLQELQESIEDFDQFYEARRERLRPILRDLLHRPSKETRPD